MLFSSAWTGAVAALIGVPIVMALLRRLYPVSRDLDVGRSLDDLRREYGKWEFVTAALVFIIVPVTTFLWWRLFLAAASGSGFSADGDVVTLRPTQIAWLLPAMVLGTLSASPLLDASLRGLLGSRYREFVAYQKLRHGFDTEAISIPFYLVFGGLAAIAAALLFDWYAAFTPAGIELNPLFGFGERTLGYADVARIETAPTFIAPIGKTVSRRMYVLRFSDASSWNANEDPSGATEDQLRAIVEAVSARSGVTITELPVITREMMK